MKAITLWQPWAWCIIHAGKDIENRTWATSYRGPIVIHAAARQNRKYHGDVSRWIRQHCGIIIPPFETLRRGQLVGVVTILAMVVYSNSPWFVGPVGWILNNPRPVKPVAIRGKQRLFDVTDSLLDYGD